MSIFRSPGASALIPVAFVAAISVVSGCGDKGDKSDVVVTDTVIADTAESADTEDIADTAEPAHTEDTADAGVIDAVSDIATDAVADVTGEFHWKAGCEASAASVIWTKIEDDTFLRGPFIQMADRETVTVVWRVETITDEQGCVKWSYGETSGTECGTADEFGQYEIPISGLPAETEITYSASVGETGTADLTFRTMPDTPRSMKFLVYADTHNTMDSVTKMADIALSEGVEFGICVGDVAHNAFEEEYTTYFDSVRNLASRVNLWAVPGNHDDNDPAEFCRSFVLPEGSSDPYDISQGVAEGYWDRRIGNVWIGGGWVRDFYMSTPETDWGEVGFFRQRFESEEFKTATWRLFFIHQPAYVVEWPGCDYTGEECLKTAMIPMLKNAGVQASFHGHMHGIEYGVVDGVATFIIGGVGGSLDAASEDDPPCDLLEGWFNPWFRHYGDHSFAIVETLCDRMTVKIMSVDGEVIDTPEVTLPETEFLAK